MNELLKKKELNKNITTQQFIEDMDCLFENLKQVYGMYEYFGEEQFQRAKEEIIQCLQSETGDEGKTESNGGQIQTVDFEHALDLVRRALSFIKDGHFYIGKPSKPETRYPYAVRYGTFEGMDYIDCKKCYYDTPEEKQQLEEFAKLGKDYRNKEPLILDLRDNQGGSTVYIYDFLKDLIGEEPGYSLRFLQRSSALYRDYLKMRGIDWTPEQPEQWAEEFCPVVSNEKPIYVLMNEKTASAAEEGIAFLKNMENVTLVGNHTKGCVSCGNCFPIYLPHSHLEAYFGTGLLLYDGHRNIDAEGGFQGDMDYETFHRIMSNRPDAGSETVIG